jgi:glycosyltransferase involved in cell wall biosynthesis
MKTINVLQFICPSGFYGAERWVLALAKNLAPTRVNCRLAITLESGKQNIELYHRFGRLGLKADQIAMSGRFDPRVVYQVATFLRRNNIQIIHTHGYKSDILGLLAARLAGIKAVATPHGFENSPDRKLQLYIKIGSWALRYFDRVAPLSEELKDDIIKLNIKSEKIRLIMNGVDLDEIDAERVSIAPQLQTGGEKRIGYVGQIAHRKNVADLIKTFNSLYEDHKDVRLTLIGDGPQRQPLEEFAKSLPSSSHIEFLGYRSDRLAIMKHFDLFTMTSSLEGIPRCMMEAMAMGAPVAAFAIPGVDKLVIHEKTGLSAKFGDIASLKHCWERILFDENFASQIAKNARAHIVENFSAKRMAEEYTELYEEMVNESVSGKQ